MPKIDGVKIVNHDILELRLPNAHPGAYVISGHLFFRLLDGSAISCACIASPYAEQIVELINTLCDKAYEPAMAQGKIITQYRELFMSLLDAKQKRYDLNPARADPPHRVDVVQIEKEEYERWQRVQKIIDDAAYKPSPP